MPRKSNKKSTTSKKSSDKKGNKSGNTVNRPPVVSILGHVDHGKTSLLDKIRETNFQEKEAGGITQSIGAYQIEHNGQLITFVDTPGHEAFTAMRARGGAVADIVVLVVAANEGVKPQTVESIGHARAADVPIIVAFNKVDLDTANVQKVKQELMEHEIITEDNGGDVVSVEVSAKTGAGIDNLLEMISLVFEVNQKEIPEKDHPYGIIIESRQDPRTGIVATGIMQYGEIAVGDFLATEKSWGKIKRMSDWRGENVKTASVGTPVEILGFTAAPNAGDTFIQVADEKEAREMKVEDEEVVKEKSEEVEKIVPLIIKADTHGALEAFRASLEALSDEEARVDIIHAGLSDVNEADVVLAGVSQAIILGFNVSIDSAASNAAQMENVPVMTYDIIYHALEDVGDLLDSEVEKIRAVGEAEVLQVFELSDGTYVAGSKVLEGHLTRGAKVQVIREDEVVFESRITSLRYEKDEKSKIEEGSECGIITGKNFEFNVGDILLTFGQ